MNRQHIIGIMAAILESGERAAGRNWCLSAADTVERAEVLLKEAEGKCVKDAALRIRDERMKQSQDKF